MHNFKHKLFTQDTLFISRISNSYLLTKQSMQITVIGDEFLRKFECRYATEKLLNRLFFIVWALPSAIYGSPGGTFLLINYHLLLNTYYLLLITYYLSLITYYLLLIISFITPITVGNSIVHSP